MKINSILLQWTDVTTVSHVYPELLLNSAAVEISGRLPTGEEINMASECTGTEVAMLRGVAEKILAERLKVFTAYQEEKNENQD